MGQTLAEMVVEANLATKADLTAHEARLVKLLERPHARFHRLTGAKAPIASNLPFAIFLDTPRPPAGWMWLLQWAIIHGDDPTVSAAIANVRAAVMVGTRPRDAAIVNPPTSGLDYAGVIIPGVSVPSGALTVPDKNVIYTEEELYAVLVGTGLVAGAAFYHFTVGVIELPQTGEALMW